MQKGGIIIDKTSPLAAYLDENDINADFRVEERVHDTKSKNDPVGKFSGILRIGLRWYLKYLCFCGLDPLLLWCRRRCILQVRGLGLFFHLLLLVVLVGGAISTRVAMIRIVLLGQVNISVILLLCGYLCSVHLHKLDLKICHQLSVLHKFQCIFMGVPISAPLIPAKTLDARLASGEYETAWSPRVLRMTLQNLLNDMSAICRELHGLPRITHEYMRLSELQALHREIFYTAIPDILEDLSSQAHQFAAPEATLWTLCRFFVLLGMMGDITLNSYPFKEMPTGDASSLPLLPAKQQALSVHPKLISGVSSARRHIAELRCAFETAAIQLWECECQLFDTMNAGLLSVMDHNNELRMSLTQLQRAEQQLESIMSAVETTADSNTLDAYSLRIQEELGKSREAICDALALLNCQANATQVVRDKNQSMRDYTDAEGFVAAGTSVSSSQSAVPQVLTMFENEVDNLPPREIRPAGIGETVDVLTAVVDYSDTDRLEEQYSSHQANIGLQRVMRTHLVAELATTLQILGKSKVYRVRKLMGEMLVDCGDADDAEAAAEEEETGEGEYLAPDSPTESSQPKPPQMQHYQQAIRFDMSDLRSALCLRTQNDEVILSTTETDSP